ncbi:MAG: MATE family efflux transporter [Muribaculaceae bacterium]|nr:MATE family efflux transporter [Muribaculaceae bacterium]
MEKNRIQEATHGDIARLATGSIPRLLWEYSLPAVVGIVVMSLYNVVDRIFIGQGVGTDAIAGLAITFPVMNVATAFGVLIGAGASARISIMLGAGDREGAERVLGTSLVLSLVFGLFYMSCFAIWLTPILRAFGASDATLPYAYDFISVLLPGLLLTNITYNFNNIMRASGYPVRAMVTMFLGAGVNVILAPLFIFVFDWGIRGAALATDIAMASTAVFVIAHFVDKRTTLRFRRGIYRPSWRIVFAIISIGSAPAIVNFAASAINVLVNRTILNYGTDLDIAAVGIFTTYTSLLVMIMIGICQGMQPIVGYNYGAGHFNRLTRAYGLATGWSSAIAVAGCAFALSFPELIARAFTKDQALIDTTVRALRHTLPAFWMVGFQIVSTNFFQSIGKAAKSIVLSLCRQVLFLIPCVLILPSLMGLDGVWISFPVSDSLATVVTVVLLIVQFRALRRLRLNKV